MQTILYYGWTFGIVIIIMLLVPPTRELLKMIAMGPIAAGLSALMKTILLWQFWLLKRMMTAHLNLLRNLVTPRNVIYQTLEKPADDE